MFLAKRRLWIASASCLMVCQTLFAAGSSSSSHGSSQPPGAQPLHSPVQKNEKKSVIPLTLHPKELLPIMAKPFGMPGVVGFVNEKWEGNDYLGYLTSNISVSIEILKGENVPNVDQAALESEAREVLSKENLTPQAEVVEGPPLPFFHVLLIVYPVEKDKYVIFAAGRLFEQIQVMRKNFSPAGYWQGITWENQDIVPATTKDLDTQLKETTVKLVKAFVDRYRQYNPINPDSKRPPTGETE